MSILRKLINQYDYNLTMTETKELLDSILNNTFVEYFNLKFKSCFDEIFGGIEYEVDNKHEEEKNFPDNFIPPRG